MRDTENALMLLALARQDFSAALTLKNAEDTSDRIYGFHAQQVVEKTLKAWLAFLGVEYPFTHSLNMLFASLEDNLGLEPLSAFRSLDMLTPFAVQFRYSAYDDNNHELDRDGIAVELRKLLDHVTALLEENEA
ncbi:MAG: HEPN domain-containing protein [Armatimonadetes bacterium]|nr:HEPN domain-containing protein [Armatimonadota bacterium]